MTASFRAAFLLGCGAALAPYVASCNGTGSSAPTGVERDAGDDAPCDGCAFAGPSEAADEAADETADATAGASGCPPDVPCGCTCPTGDDGGVCVCPELSMPACPSNIATYASCSRSGSCFGCAEGFGFSCGCDLAGTSADAGPQWICIGTEYACTGGRVAGASAALDGRAPAGGDAGLVCGFSCTNVNPVADTCGPIDGVCLSYLSCWPGTDGGLTTSFGACSAPCQPTGNGGFYCPNF
ncbi:MAG: hypothetical protein ABSC94_10560 [Polyangiaceae bacterium]|jgi:hypothetical protein